MHFQNQFKCSRSGDRHFYRVLRAEELLPSTKMHATRDFASPTPYFCYNSSSCKFKVGYISSDKESTYISSDKS